MNKMTVQELQERILQIKPLDEKAMEEAKMCIRDRYSG